MIADTCRRLLRRFTGKGAAASSPGALRHEMSTARIEPNASDKNKPDKENVQQRDIQGVGAAIRAGQAKLAQSKLRRWRDRYLRARRNAVQLALSRLDKENCTEE